MRPSDRDRSHVQSHCIEDAPPAAGRTVAVVTPAYNAQATLGSCLTAIAALERAPDEVLVYDDGSTDDTAHIIELHGATLIRGGGPPRGPAHGRNVAAAAAQSDLILFVDADVLVAPDALSRLLRELEETGVQAAFGSYDDKPASRRPASLYVNLRHHHVHQVGARAATTFWSGLGLVERSTFLDVGGFDAARFPKPSIEDIELGARLIARGARIRLVPEAHATHCKDWRLLELWRTDIFRRAYPWSRLIVDRQAPGADLNVGVRERVKAAVAVAVLALTVLAPLRPLMLAGATAAAALYVWLNLDFLKVLRRAAPEAAAKGMVLHWIYHLYSSAVFAGVRATAGLRRRGGGRASPEAPVQAGRDGRACLR